MIKNKIKHKGRPARKISLVVFITLLIWIWADLSQDESYRASTAVVTISASSDPALWVRFAEDNNTEFHLKQTRLEGPAIRIAELKKDIAEGAFQLHFTLDPQEFDLTASDTPITVPLIQVLRNNKDLLKKGIKVTECLPETVKLSATKLVKKSVEVFCYDENNMPLLKTDIEPKTVKMLVPPNWQGEKLKAFVKLTLAQQNKAVKEPIKVYPYIELASAIIRKSSTAVEVKLSEDGVKLVDRTVQGSLGYIVSSDILDNYQIKLDNYDDFVTAIAIKATEEAFTAYNNQKYKLLLEIKSEDIKSDPAVRYPIYNFPVKHLQKGEIIASQKLVQAKFHLIPRNK